MIDIGRTIYRLEQWAQYIQRLNEESSLSCTILGALLGESMEGYRLFGAKGLSKTKAFACLIRGKGAIPPESLEDVGAAREVGRIIDGMPRHLREIKRVLYTEFLLLGAPETKAMKISLKLETYKSHLANGVKYVGNRLSNDYP